MIFRWSSWGNKSQLDTLLYYSISSFQHFFGFENHKYLLFTDDISGHSESLLGLVEVNLFSDFTSPFNIESRATWRKWIPSLRIDINQAECYVDSDVFLLKPPKEIFDFLENKTVKFCILDEFEGDGWQHGCFEKYPTETKLYINAGLFIQNSGADITENLLPLFDWWQSNVPNDMHSHHDEQGALATALTSYYLRNQLTVLPKEKYMIVSKYQNSDLRDLSNVTLLHSTYPNHPAFFKFKDDITQILQNGH